MPKKGSERARKFTEKYDPNVVMLRWKALRDFSLKKFYLTPEKHAELDEEIRILIDRFILPYGKAGQFMDYVRELVYMWGMLSDADKEFYRQRWIQKGFPSELFDQVVKYIDVLQNKVTTYVKNNMVLWFFSELSPLPQEAYSPKEEDYTEKMETEYETYTPEKQPYWFQYGMSIGANIFYFGNVFKGFTIQLPLLESPLFTYNSFKGVDLELFIPAITRELPEYYILAVIPNMLYQVEIPISQIIRNLVMLDPSFSVGINEYDLWLYQMQSEISKEFPVASAIITNCTAFIQLAIALTPISQLLTDCTAFIELAFVLTPISQLLTNCTAYVYSANVMESQILINSLPNPSYEVSI